MSLFNVFDIAGSGMSAQSVRLNTTASNMANADTVAATEDKAYKARQPVFASVMQQNAGMQNEKPGVKILGIVENQAAHNMRYEPANPLANEEGYVYESNVNIVDEMASMISASRSYQNNIEILNTSKDMLLKTLKLGQ